MPVTSHSVQPVTDTQLSIHTQLPPRAVSVTTFYDLSLTSPETTNWVHPLVISDYEDRSPPEQDVLAAFVETDGHVFTLLYLGDDAPVAPLSESTSLDIHSTDWVVLDPSQFTLPVRDAFPSQTTGESDPTTGIIAELQAVINTLYNIEMVTDVPESLWKTSPVYYMLPFALPSHPFDYPSEELMSHQPPINTKYNGDGVGLVVSLPQSATETILEEKPATHASEPQSANSLIHTSHQSLAVDDVREWLSPPQQRAIVADADVVSVIAELPHMADRYDGDYVATVFDPNTSQWEPVAHVASSETTIQQLGDCNNVQPSPKEDVCTQTTTDRSVGLGFTVSRAKELYSEPLLISA